MATAPRIPGTTADGPVAPPAPRRKRILACVLCQQRKVKCDRHFPCANCTRVGAECVSLATPQQPRRRRFAERELLDRVSQYEDLLRRNSVSFTPLHPPSASVAVERETGSSGYTAAALVEPAPRSPAVSVERRAQDASCKTESVDFLHAIKKMTTVDIGDDSDNLPRDDVNAAQDTSVQDTPLVHHRVLFPQVWDFPRFVDGHGGNWFLFGTPQENLDLSTLHPEQTQILKLWQTYLENIDPMLKCTHSPTLQPRIVDALGHMASTSPSLEALMFSIYCVSVMSLSEGDCLMRFGSSRHDLLARYQFACQQALLRCQAWRSSDIETLTATYLYLTCLRAHSNPSSMTAILAVAIRNAQGLGLHDELSNAKFSVLEAEIRRRLWWSLVAFDHRTCELTEYKTSTLTPLWDCKLPTNVNDFELRSEMKKPLVSHERPSEALFAVVWAEVANALRQSTFHLSFINPILVGLRRLDGTYTDELSAYEASIENKFLSFCDPDDPISFMTTWMARGQLARHRLLSYYHYHSSKDNASQTDAQRSVALSHALTMLECDTKIRLSPLTKRFVWLSNFHVPALAYFHILSHTKNCPNEPRQEQVWKVMAANWSTRAACRASDDKRNEQLSFATFAQSVMRGWKAFGAALKQDFGDGPQEAPAALLRTEIDQYGEINAGVGAQGLSMAGTVDFGFQSAVSHDPVNSGTPGLNGQAVMSDEMVHLWSAIDWRCLDTHEW